MCSLSMALSAFGIACPVSLLRLLTARPRIWVLGKRVWFGGVLGRRCSSMSPRPCRSSSRPRRTLLARIPGVVADLLAAHRVPRALIDEEVANMAELRLAPTMNRSLVGMLNEFGFISGGCATSSLVICSAYRCISPRRRAVLCTDVTSVPIASWRLGSPN